MKIDAIKINAGAITDYRYTITCGSTLATGASCTVSRTFTPTKVASARNAEMEIIYNQATRPTAGDDGGRPRELGIAGEGLTSFLF